MNSTGSNELVILSYYFPPLLSIATQRIMALADSFIKSGWSVTIITSDPAADTTDATKIDAALGMGLGDGIQVIRVREPSYRRRFSNHALSSLMKVVRKAFSLFEPYDSYGAWSRRVEKAAFRLIKNKRIDCIFVSGPPHSLVPVGKTISAHFKIPLVLDFRDNWSCVLGHQPVPLLRKALSYRAEKSAVLTADLVSAVQEDLFEYWSLPRSKCYHLINGFDPQAFPDPSKLTRFPTFTLVYLGTLYEGRDPELFFRAVSLLREEIPGSVANLSIEFIGWVYGTDMLRLEAKYKTKGIIKVKPPVAYEESLTIMAKADALILILPDGGRSAGTVLTGKLFEYLYSGNDIVALVPENGAAANLIHRHGAGVVIAHDDAVGLAEYLRAHITTSLEATRKGISYRSIPEFERANLNATFVNEVCSLVANNKGA